MGVHINPDQAKTLLAKFDRDNSGSVSFDEFIRVLRGDLSPSRVAMIRQAYDKLDINKDGSVTLDDVARIYDVSQHPDWIAVWAFVVPAALAAKVTVSDIPSNSWDGLKCYVGTNSLMDNGPSCPPDSAHAGDDCSDDCGSSILFVNIYFMFNLGYNILIILILKYGSANILWLAMTVMVPLGNCAFALDFVPGHKPLTVYNFIGLFLILGGLLVYRFGAAALAAWMKSREEQEDAEIDGASKSFAKSFSKSFSQSFVAGTASPTGVRSRSGSALSKRSFHHSFHGTCAIESVQPLQDVDDQLTSQSLHSDLDSTFLPNP